MKFKVGDTFDLETLKEKLVLLGNVKKNEIYLDEFMKI